VGGKSNKLRALLDSLGADDDRPRIDDFDELLEALRREHGEAGRPDLVTIPRIAGWGSITE
jgi:hypothetical protein